MEKFEKYVVALWDNFGGSDQNTRAQGFEFICGKMDFSQRGRTVKC